MPRRRERHLDNREAAVHRHSLERLKAINVPELREVAEPILREWIEGESELRWMEGSPKGRVVRIEKLDVNVRGAIADKTWKAPFDVMSTSNAVVPYNHNQSRDQKIRYDPSLLPKFRHDGGVEEWIMTVQQFIDTHGETVVCPTQNRYTCHHELYIRRIYAAGTPYSGQSG